MAIENNVTRDHILMAIQRIDNEIIFNPKRKARLWALRYNDKLYPRKLVISYANVYPNNVELNPNPKVFTTYMAQTYLKSKGFLDIIKLKK